MKKIKTETNSFHDRNVSNCYYICYGSIILRTHGQLLTILNGFLKKSKVHKHAIKNRTDSWKIGIGNYTTKDNLNRTCMSRTKTRRGWNFFMDYQTSAKRYV